jgi:hypothetical protein
MKFEFAGNVLLENVFAAATDVTTVPLDDTSDGSLDWLGRLRMLIGVPFEYLVPDERLLPTESMRFFYIDRNWTDAAVDGAMASGIYGTRDRLTLQQRHGLVRDAVDEAERHQRVGGEAVTGDSAATLAGFLMRSRAVSGWPGLHVRAWRGERPLVIMRMERLAPAVLLVIFDDVCDRMEIEEPRQGIQFGARAARAGEAAGSWWLDVRDPDTGVEVPTNAKVEIPFRAGSAGVIHLTELRRRLVADHGDVVGTSLSSAELGLQLLRYPYRQHFGRTTGTDFVDVFATAFRADEVLGWLTVGPGSGPDRPQRGGPPEEGVRRGRA